MKPFKPHSYLRHIYQGIPLNITIYDVSTQLWHLDLRSLKENGCTLRSLPAWSSTLLVPSHVPCAALRACCVAHQPSPRPMQEIRAIGAKIERTWPAAHAHTPIRPPEARSGNAKPDTGAFGFATRSEGKRRRAASRRGPRIRRVRTRISPEPLALCEAGRHPARQPSAPDPFNRRLRAELWSVKVHDGTPHEPMSRRQS